MKILSAGAVLSFIALGASAQKTGINLSLESSSTLAFDGTSTLHNFTCVAKEINAVIVAEEISTDKPLEVQHPLFTQVTITIPVKKIESGKPSMDENMWEALKADEFSEIVYTMREAKVLPSDSTSGLQVETLGSLTVAGKSKEITMLVQWSRTPEGKLHFQGTTKLLMTDFGIDPPTMMLGVITTGDEITVRFDLFATPQDNYVIEGK